MSMALPRRVQSVARHPQAGAAGMAMAVRGNPHQGPFRSLGESSVRQAEQ
jgi:hypothetical protein